MSIQDTMAQLYTKIDSMSTAEVDGLNLGAIQLDRDGKILAFNRFESSLAKLSAESVLGRNFFRDVAPCTDVKEFSGKFREGVANKSLNVSFRYRFIFKNQPPRNVLIHMYYSAISETTWVFVRPMDDLST
jgi:photoactive yellow protein